jgi:DNA-binding NarL/FixJ family response regulator
MHDDLRRLLSMATVLVSVAVMVPVVAQIGGSRPVVIGGWALASAAFLASSLASLASTRRSTRIALLAVAVVASLVVVLLACDGFEGALLVLVAAQVGGLVPRRFGIAWVLVQTVLLAAAIGWHWNARAALLLSPPYGGFQLLALFMAEVIASTSTARRELERANAGLSAAQHVAAEHTRLAERVRIARELHDAVGHQLTALSMHLEVAGKLASGEAASEVAIARELARSSLADIRDVVEAPPRRRAARRRLGAADPRGGDARAEGPRPRSGGSLSRRSRARARRPSLHAGDRDQRAAAFERRQPLGDDRGVGRRAPGIGSRRRGGCRGRRRRQWAPGDARAHRGRRWSPRRHDRPRSRIPGSCDDPCEAHMTAKIRVLIVENEAIVRQGLRRLLELDPEIAVLGEARDGDEALEQIRRLTVDVVLLDMRMPGRDGIGVLEALRRDGPHVPCLVLTTFDDPELLLRAVRAGASGYLLKDTPYETLGSAIRRLAAGGTFLQPALTEGLVRGFDAFHPRVEASDQVESLTERELDVLRLMAGGYANREIAGVLEVAERTVKNHVSSVLAKLGVRDRTRAVLKALEKRLL